MEFFLIGTFSIGGGLATLPYLINLVDKYDWFTYSTLMNMVAISESTPGPIGINMATYVGYVVKGIFGGIITSLAVMMSGVIFMIIVSKQLHKYKNNPILIKVFYGLRPTITALIGFAAFTMIKTVLINIVDQPIILGSTLVLFILTVLLSKTSKLSPIAIIGFGAIISFIVPF
jgi:chromate transporter